MLSTTATTVHYAATSMLVNGEAAGNAFLAPVAFIVSIELLRHNFFFGFEVPPLGAVAFLQLWRCNTNADHTPPSTTIKSCVYRFHRGLALATIFWQSVPMGRCKGGATANFLAARSCRCKAGDILNFLAECSCGAL